MNCFSFCREKLDILIDDDGKLHIDICYQSEDKY